MARWGGRCNKGGQTKGRRMRTIPAGGQHRSSLGCVRCPLAIALPVTILSLLASLVTVYHILSHPALHCHSIAQMPCHTLSKEGQISHHLFSDNLDVSLKLLYWIQFLAFLSFCTLTNWFWSANNTQ